jgi:hypothetical protein
LSTTRDFSSAPRRTRVTPRERALLAGAALLLAAAGYSTAAAWNDLREAAAASDEVRRDTAALDARARELSARTGPGEALAEQALSSAGAPPPRVVWHLGQLLPPDVRLESLQLGYGARVAVHMQVVSRSAASYDLFLQRLEASPAFAEVVPGDENRAGAVRASIVATYRGGGR